MSSVVVKYGSYTFDIAPFVSRSQSSLYEGAGKSGQVTEIALNGDLLVGGGTYDTGYEGLASARNALMSAFESDYQSLVVTEDSEEILRFDYCIVEGVSFESSGNGIRSKYSVTLKCYESDLFVRNYGVISPSDKTSYSYGQDGKISISRTISAQGIYTGYKKPIQNAIDWVNAKTGIDFEGIDTSQAGTNGALLPPTPFFVTGMNSLANVSNITPSNCVLKSLNKNVNRMEGSYSVSEEYVLQTGDLWNAPRIDKTVSEISTKISSGINDDRITINVDYSLVGSMDESATSLRNKAKQITVTGTLLSIATGVDLGFANTLVDSSTLNFPYLPETISIEDQAETNKTIKISCDFFTNLGVIEGNGYIFDPSFSVSTDDITSETSVTLNAQIKGIGPRKYRYEVVSGVHDGFAVWSGEYYKQCRDMYTGMFGADAWPLNPNPSNSSVKENKFKGSIDVSYSFNNKDFPKDSSGNPLAGTTNFVMSVVPSMKKYSANPSSNSRGLYSIFDLGVKTRESVDISTSFNNIYNMSVDGSMSIPTYIPSEEKKIHEHFLSGYVSGPSNNRGVEIVDGSIIKGDEKIDVQGFPFNSVSIDGGSTQELSSKPFNE